MRPLSERAPADTGASLGLADGRSAMPRPAAARRPSGGPPSHAASERSPAGTAAPGASGPMPFASPPGHQDLADGAASATPPNWPTPGQADESARQRFEQALGEPTAPAESTPRAGAGTLPTPAPVVPNPGPQRNDASGVASPTPESRERPAPRVTPRGTANASLHEAPAERHDAVATPAHHARQDAVHGLPLSAMATSLPTPANQPSPTAPPVEAALAPSAHATATAKNAGTPLPVARREPHLAPEPTLPPRTHSTAHAVTPRKPTSDDAVHAVPPEADQPPPIPIPANPGPSLPSHGPSTTPALHATPPMHKPDRPAQDRRLRRHDSGRADPIAVPGSPSPDLWPQAPVAQSSPLAAAAPGPAPGRRAAPAPSPATSSQAGHEAATATPEDAVVVLAQHQAPATPKPAQEPNGPAHEDAGASPLDDRAPLAAPRAGVAPLASLRAALPVQGARAVEESAVPHRKSAAVPTHPDVADAATVPRPAMSHHTAGPASTPVPSSAAAPVPVTTPPSVPAATSDDVSSRLRTQLADMVQRLMVGQAQGGGDQVRMVLQDAYLPGTVVSVQQAEAQLQVVFECSGQGSRQQLDRSAPAIARSLARRFGKDVVVRVQGDEDGDGAYPSLEAHAGAQDTRE